MGVQRRFIIEGRTYRWNGWAGCQLESFEWRRPNTLEPRFILGRAFYVNSLQRRPFRRWRVTWGLRPIDYQALHRMVNDLYADIVGGRA